MMKSPWLMFLALFLCIGCPSVPDRTTKGEAKNVFLFPRRWEEGSVVTVERLSFENPSATSSIKTVLFLKSYNPPKKITLYKGEKRIDRRTTFAFQVPSLSPKAYSLYLQLEKKTHYLGGITLVKKAKILLVSDKKTYQPGQKIFLRALVRSDLSKKAQPNQAITFEVEDPKGNLVYRVAKKTSSYGISSLTFQLASEISHGLYTLRALVGKAKGELKIQVKTYVVPKIKMIFVADKGRRGPRGRMYRGEIRAKYFFGKPVVGAVVEFQVTTSHIKNAYYGRTFTDKKGRGAIQFVLPPAPNQTNYLLPFKKGTSPYNRSTPWMEIEFRLRDRTGLEQKLVRRINLPSSHLFVYVFPEREKLLWGRPNYIYVLTALPNGQPVSADVRLAISSSILSAKSDEFGLCRIKIPLKNFLPHSVYRRYRYNSFYYPNNFQLVTAWAKDSRGRRGKAQMEIRFSYTKASHLVIESDKVLYKKGETLHFRAFSNLLKARGLVVVLKNARVLWEKSFDLRKGEASFSLPLKAVYEGKNEIYGLIQDEKGNLQKDVFPFYVVPSSSSQLTIKLDKDVYRPGEKARINFHLKSPLGKGQKGALGIFIVDEAALAVGARPKELLRFYQYLNHPSGSPDFFQSLGKVKKLNQIRQILARYLLGRKKQRPKKRHHLAR